jgi:hypothetical protein
MLPFNLPRIFATRAAKESFREAVTRMHARRSAAAAGPA